MLAEDDVRRQVRVERSQAKAEPRPDAGQRDRGRARVHRQHRLKMLDDVGVQAPHDAQLVGHRPQMRKQLAHRQARFAVLREAEGQGISGSTSVPRRWIGRNALAVVDRELGLGIERVDVREAAGEEDENQMLGPCGMVRPPRRQRMPAVGFGRQGEGRYRPALLGRQAEPGQLQEVTTWRNRGSLHAGPLQRGNENPKGGSAVADRRGFKLLAGPKPALHSLGRPEACPIFH